MQPGAKKIWISALLILGVSAVGYGMATDDNPIFITGLIIVITGYLIVRTKLKNRGS